MNAKLVETRSGRTIAPKGLVHHEDGQSWRYEHHEDGRIVGECDAVEDRSGDEWRYEAALVPTRNSCKGAVRVSRPCRSERHHDCNGRQYRLMPPAELSLRWVFPTQS